MSRVGRAPISIPQGVQVTARGREVAVTGPLGEIASPLPEGLELIVEGTVARLHRKNDERALRAKHGMARAILNNCVLGVSKGWQKKLELVGVGYRAQLKGNELSFSLGYSHDVKYPLPAGIKAQITDQTKIELTGNDRQKVGQVAAEIRALRPPEPYKGKGVKYSDEVIRRKAGKTGKAGKGK